MPRNFALPPFLGRTMPVELVAELQSVSAIDSTIQLLCQTKRYEPQIFGYYGTDCETVLRAPQPGRPATVQLDFCSDEIFRLRYAPGHVVSEVDTPMVLGQFAGPSDLAWREDETGLTVWTATLRIELVREPWRLSVYTRGGHLVWRSRPLDIDPFRRPEFQWSPHEQRWLFYHRYAYPLGSADHGERQHAFLSFDLHHDEHIYGFGEGYGRLDKRQTHQQLWNVEALSNASPGSYKNIPFFMSTRGYGFFANTSHGADVHVGDREHTAISLTVDDSTALDCYLIYGPSLREILPRYTAITGQPALPPKWSFGLWMGRISYNRQEQVESVARDLREHRIPCDVIHIDTDWYEEEWACDLRFGPSKFPDPPGMLARLADLGFRVCLWQWPILLVGTSMFQEGHAGGYLMQREHGKPYIFTGFEDDAGLIDYSNPEAVAWVQEKFRDLFRQGVAAIKVDFGEGAPPDAVYSDVPSPAMHNLYPLLYNRAIFEVSQEFQGEGQALVWARSAWAGSQRFPVHWSGDGIARFEDLACVLRSALSFGLSGFPFYSHDIGGFAGLPSPELYVRWAQFGLFSSHARAHGEPPREPWAYGPEAEAIVRRYAELRYRLLPYIYSEAVESCLSSLPMLRALVLDFQDDPNAVHIEDQYLFGRSLLVAPLLDESNRRQVYLPQGTWFDYWSKDQLQGGRWIDVEAPLDMLPLYVAAGAVLPYGPPLQYVDEKPTDPLTVELYVEGPAPGSAAATYTIHDQDRPHITVAYRLQEETLTVETSPAPGWIELLIYGLHVARARLADQPLAVERLAHGGCRVAFDGRQSQTVTLTSA